MANPPNLHTFGLWEEPELPEETHADTGRMCRLHTDGDPSRESNLAPWCCEAAVLTTVLPYRPNQLQPSPYTKWFSSLEKTATLKPPTQIWAEYIEFFGM